MTWLIVWAYFLIGCVSILLVAFSHEEENPITRGEFILVVIFLPQSMFLFLLAMIWKEIKSWLSEPLSEKNDNFD